MLTNDRRLASPGVYLPQPVVGEPRVELLVRGRAPMREHEARLVRAVSDGDRVDVAPERARGVGALEAQVDAPEVGAFEAQPRRLPRDRLELRDGADWNGPPDDKVRPGFSDAPVRCKGDRIAGDPQSPLLELPRLGDIVT